MTSPTKPSTMTRRLRELLARPQALMAPGAADALTARLVARQGFEACMQGQVICVPGAVNRAANWASRSTPRALLRRAIGLMAHTKYGRA